MKKSLSVRLVILIAGTILISSLITILLVYSLSSSRFKAYALEKDRNLAHTIAGYLTTASEEDRLHEAILSLSLAPQRSRQMPSRMKMMPMMRVSGEMDPVAFLVTDKNGVILKGNVGKRVLSQSSVSDRMLTEGVPFYNINREIMGFVFTGAMLEGSLSQSDHQYLKSLLLGVLFSAMLAAVLASLIGVLFLKKILKPLKSLNQGVRRLSRGDYSFRVDHPGSGDELSRLAVGFNEMAASLQASEQWKKQIISDTAHELRTPVSLIMGNLEMMLEGIYQADEKRLRSLYDESTLLADLIRDLHELSSAESSMTDLEKEVFDPDELISVTAESFRAVRTDKKLQLHVDTRFHNSWTGDRRKLQQVLKNLLSNAVKFTPSEGSITLRTFRVEDKLIIEVEDTGPGIPEVERLKVFDRFYRLDKSRNRQEGGSGLGLAISKAIIELHNGYLEVVEGEDRGALFRITLPIN